MKNFKIRAISGLVYVLIFISGVTFSQYSLSLLLLFLSLFSLIEYFQIIKKVHVYPMKWIGFIICFATHIIFALYAWGELEKKMMFILFPVLLLPFYELFKSRNRTINVIALFAGSVYISGSLAIYNFLPAVSFLEDNTLILCILILTWSNDTGAYLFGKLMGRAKLVPRTSPGKTWEGTIGGFLLTILAAWALSVFFKEQTKIIWLIDAVLVVLFGTLGDILVSKLKREARVKDTGRLIPGHGGVLDRIDSFMMIGPVMFLFHFFVL
ncbi:MAG: phosphatidate cytidylyltransferase [Flavobacteriales bacterium]